MLGDASNTVLESGDLLTAAEVAKAAGFSASNPSAQPNKGKKEGQISALRHREVDSSDAVEGEDVRLIRPVW
jgi:hypothetical protein